MIDVQITEEQNAILQAAKSSGNLMPQRPRWLRQNLNPRNDRQDRT